METSALNLAHQQHRRAEAHLRYRRFDEAIKCHKEASRLLEEAMKLTNVAKALESLTLQRDYHIQQESVIKMKSNCYEKHLKSAACDHKKIINPEIPVQPERESHHLQAEIYKTMEEADSLLQILLKKGTLSKEVLGNKENNLPENTVTEQEAVARLEPSEWKPCMSGSRLPKDDQTVIEELRVVNEQLRSQVVQLLEDLDLCHKENDHLKRRILRLEGQFGKYPVVGRGSTNSHLPMCDMFNDCILQRKGSENNPVGPASCLRVTTESSPGSSPFVLSPCSELSPDGGRQLPALAPLEMPAFDFPGLLPKQTSEEIK
ncbi:nuclear receptor-binding factor 2 [Hetaerina americana]|uniref:nuclear receptor-binding factor 2 n=1 Tax=Hetaerina americana TaxID=62018 RepID=UPI003A7F5612